MSLPEILAMFLRVEGRIKAFATWKGERTKEWLANKGCLPGGQLDYHDLISSAWVLLMKDPERAFASDQELLHYFTGQISGTINNIRRSAQAQFLYVSVAGARGIAEGPHVISEDDESLATEDDFDAFERALLLQSFLRFLADRAPDLIGLLRLIAAGIEGAQGQALHLHISIAAVYRMRDELRRLALEFARHGENHD